MAAPTVLTNATIWLGGYDLTASTNEVTFNAARQEKPVSRFGDTIEATYPGAQTVDAEVKGFWDSTLDGPQFTQLTNPTASWPLSVGVGGTSGDVVYFLRTYSTNYSSMEASWGQSLPYRLTTKAATGERLGRGIVALPKATYTGTSAGTLFQLGATSATQKAVAFVHVFAINGGSWNVTLTSDADGALGGGTSRVFQTGITTAPYSTVLIDVGPVTDTYWYAQVTKVSGTSITLAVTLAIVDV